MFSLVLLQAADTLILVKKTEILSSVMYTSCKWLGLRQGKILLS